MSPQSHGEYHQGDTMNTAELRLAIKKVVDRLPPDRLASLADYVDFLNRPQLVRRSTDAASPAAS